MSDEKKEVVAPIVVKELKSSEPDLDVIVGAAQEQVFRYHGVNLATHSEYVDTMLSTPMREQETRTITFPDIEPDVWTRLMKFVGTGGGREMRLSDVNELLPIYDKYGFKDAVEMCDYKLGDMLDNVRFGNIMIKGRKDFLDELVAACVLSYELDLPQSRSKAVEFATRRLKRLSGGLEEHQIREMLPLIREEEKTLRYIVATVMGKERKMNIEEMAVLVEEKSFASMYKT